MDMPLVQALSEKLGLIVSVKSSFVHGLIADKFLPLMEQSRWLENGHIAIIQENGENFTFDPDDVDEQHVYTLLTFGFSIIQLIPDYSDHDSVDELEPPTHYALFSPARPLVKILPRLEELLQAKLEVPVENYLLLTHTVQSFSK